MLPTRLCAHPHGQPHAELFHCRRTAHILKGFNTSVDDTFPIIVKYVVRIHHHFWVVSLLFIFISLLPISFLFCLTFWKIPALTRRRIMSSKLQQIISKCSFVPSRFFSCLIIKKSFLFSLRIFIDSYLFEALFFLRRLCKSVSLC